MGEYRLEWSSGAGLSRRPFLMSPDPSVWIALEDCERIREELSRCVARGEGVGLLTGVSGVGKSLVCQILYDEFLDDGRNSDVTQVVLLQPGRMSQPSEFDAALLAGMGVELPLQTTSGMLRATLEQYLVSLDRAMLVIVDPADRLSLRVWEEIQSLAGFSHSGRTPLRWLLSGSQLLEEVLSNPHLTLLNQRIAVRANLRSWNISQTQRYIENQLRAAKGDPRQFFTESNERSIHRLTDGVPRMVNLLCDRILWHSLSENVAGPFEEWQIQAVWDEIEGIAPASLIKQTTQNRKIALNSETAFPGESSDVATPNSMESSANVDNSVLSFGALEDDDPEFAQSPQPITPSMDTITVNQNIPTDTTSSVMFGELDSSELDSQDDTAESCTSPQFASLESELVAKLPPKREPEESQRQLSQREPQRLHAVERFRSRAIFSQLRRRAAQS